MQKVSQSRKARSGFARSLQFGVGVIGFAWAFGASAGGTFPAVAQSGPSQAVRATEPAGFDGRPVSEERSSLKRALGAASQPSGQEERKLRSREERRALMLDLRNATRDMSADGDSPN